MKIKYLALIVVISATTLATKADTVISNIGAAWDNGRTFTDSWIPGEDVRTGLIFNTGTAAANIDSLSFDFLTGNSPASSSISFSAYLYQVDSGTHRPTGAALGTQSGLIADWGSTASWNQQTFTYSVSELAGLTSVTLLANTEYAIAIGENNDPVGEIYWASSSSSSYTTANGYSYIQSAETTNGGSLWENGTQKYIGSISTTAIPEPATLGLVGLFSGGLFFIRRTFMI